MLSTFWTQIKSWVNRAPADVVGIDCASNGVRLARIRQGANSPLLAGLDTLPSVAIDEVTRTSTGPFPKSIDVLPIPLKVRAKYAALSAPSSEAVIKMLRVPDQFDSSDAKDVAARLGVEQTDGYRVASRMLQAGTPRSEGHVLAAAMPDRLAAALLELLPSAGLPAPRALLFSEMGVLNAFLNDPTVKAKEETVGLIHFDQDFSVIGLFHHGLLSQFRTFSLGAATLLKKVSRALNVDEETAAGVLLDGAFDISHMIEDDYRSLKGHYVICRDFMERSENCRLQRLYITGPPALKQPFYADAQIEDKLTDWDPLARWQAAANGQELFSSEQAVDSWRWAAAMGGALSLLERP